MASLNEPINVKINHCRTCSEAKVDFSHDVRAIGACADAKRIFLDLHIWVVESIPDYMQTVFFSLKMERLVMKLYEN